MFKLGLGLCSWWKCRRKLGTLVFRFSKLSTQQFCCSDCAQRWLESEDRQHKHTHEGQHVFQFR